jgi:hypothetical protein
VLREERDWLREAQQLLADVRHFREQERLRFWPGVWRRWLLAVAFALASAASAGAGYAWWTNPTPPNSSLPDSLQECDLLVLLGSERPTAR